MGTIVAVATAGACVFIVIRYCQRRNRQ